MSLTSSYQQSETMSPNPPPAAEAIELAARHLDRMMGIDNGASSLAEKLGSVGASGSGVVSGLHDRDYPAMGVGGPESLALKPASKVSRIPLPAELIEHFGHMQCNCSMGLFTQIDRAWLTIDSDIYVWRYEDGGDLAYFDGLADTILNVAMVTPKAGILQPHIVYLLVLSTPVEIVILGVSFAGDEMQLVPEPLYTLPADQLHTSCIVGGVGGRIFMGGRDGHLHEFCYQQQEGWWGKKTSRVCHTSSNLSWLLPSFLGSFGEEDPLLQIVIDQSRNILYTRSEKGTVGVFDLGRDGQSMERVTSVTAQKMVEESSKLAATVETGNLKPIVHIAVVPMEEDQSIHLIALTGGGARLYLTTSFNSTDSRPNTLRLLHVRLPPGFSPSAPPQRPIKVHSGFYRSGLALLASSPAEAADILWIVWSGTMPQGNSVMEGQVTVPVEGHAWAMDEVVSKSKLDNLFIASFSGKNPPSAVTQHCSTSRKLVVLSAQGAIIVEPGRPVDCLRQLLVDCGGPDNEAVHSYWSLQGPEQAAATALVLATSQAIVDRQVAEWATRAFVILGGEPRLVYPGPATGTPQFLSPTQQSFHPAVMSTPSPTYSSMPYHPSPHPEIQFSARHNGLYLYLSRLLRPVWASPLLTGTAEKPESTVNLPQISLLMSQLHDLRTWMEKNSSLSSGQDRLTDNSALLREKQSLVVVRQLIVDCVQMLGLWSVIVEHTVELVVGKLSQETSTILRQAQLRDLVVSPNGRDVASNLVQCLVQTYLGDNASTDAISNRLRTLCPALYRQEDALSSKAHELLLAAAKQSKGGERVKMVSEAVNIAIQIAGHLQLGVLVSHLASCQAYTKVVEVCLAAANKRDPSQLAVHYYNNGENSDDSAGLAAYIARTECYKHCTAMLHTLLQAGSAPPTSPSVPKSPGPPPPPSPAILPPDQATIWAEQVFQLMVSSSDQLLHVSLYQWLIENKYIDKLLNIKSPHIEDFLKRGAVQHPETLAMFDLLWKYYEKSSQYVPAARILAKLADRHSTELGLSGRVQYLARAIMCVKSSEGGSSNRAAGELLHHLEEKMEVAQVQIKVLEAISGKVEAEGQISRLNSDLLDITTLYQDFAEPYQLWECKLAILQCAGHPDQPLVNAIWSNIIDQQESSANQNKVLALSNKMESLGKQYANSSKYFPLEMIVRQLEIVSCKEKGNPGWVPTCLQATGVSLPRLLDVYNRLYTTKDSIWLTLGDNLHILKVLCSLVKLFANDPSLVNLVERRQFAVVCQDAVSTYLGELYQKQSQETAVLVSSFRDIQAKLDRM